MPIYEYSCDKCHQREEILQKVGDSAPELCPQCGARNSLHRVVSSSAFHLKGGGWYKDLYSSTKPEQKSDTPASKKSDTPEKKDKDK